MSRSDSAPCIASEVTGLFGIAERPKILSGRDPLSPRLSRQSSEATPGPKSAVSGQETRPVIRKQTGASQDQLSGDSSVIEELCVLK